MRSGEKLQPRVGMPDGLVGEICEWGTGILLPVVSGLASLGVEVVASCSNDLDAVIFLGGEMGICLCGLERLELDP